MEWLNYHHLFYFFVVAREGGLAPAGRALHLSHSTLSAQLRVLEDRLGHKLFERVGRRLELTDAGREAYQYAEQIFGLGQELLGAMQVPGAGLPRRLRVGVVDVVPKLVVRRLVKPALEGEPPVRLVCREGSLERLLAELSLNTLDLVLSDEPPPVDRASKVTQRLLGDTGVTFFAPGAQARALRAGFPKSLQGAPVVLPLESLQLRRGLDAWFEREGVVPRVVAEVEDSALLKVLGAEGLGAFPGPTAMASEIQAQFAVEAVGRAEDVRQAFYALVSPRSLAHPAVTAIIEAARRTFGLSARGARRKQATAADGRE
jgi:LysR family transcriptional activator of nhaA